MNTDKKMVAWSNPPAKRWLTCDRETPTVSGSPYLCPSVFICGCLLDRYALGLQIPNAARFYKRGIAAGGRLSGDYERKDPKLSDQATEEHPPTASHPALDQRNAGFPAGHSRQRRPDASAPALAKTRALDLN